MKKFLLAFRKYFIIFICIFSYILLVYSFFVTEYWRMASLYLILFFVFIPYFLIELKDFGLTTFVWMIVIITIVEMIIIGLDSVLKITGLYVLNIAIILLVLSINSAVNNRKQISCWGIFHSGLGLFSLFVAFTFSTMFVVKNSEFNLTCDNLYDGLSSFLMFVSKPLRIPIEEVNKIQSNVDDFGNTKLKDIIGINSIADFQKNNVNDIGFLENIKLSGDQLYYSGDQFLDGTGYSNIINSYSFTGEKQGIGLLGKVDELKNMIVENVIKDKRDVDTEVCSYIIESIKIRYKDPTFKISVIILLFFLIWPFIRIILFIITTINYFVFKLLSLFKVYTIRIVTDEVEEIV